MLRKIVVTAGARAHDVSARLVELGAAAIEEVGEMLITFTDTQVSGTEIEGRLLEAGATTVSITDARDVFLPDWRGTVGAQQIGRLRVTPPWFADADAVSQQVIIEPGMAFGTGDHPTTRGCLRLLQGVDCTGRRMIDLGAGSGVLTIAAALLGARVAVGIESDPDAIANAEENARLNSVIGRVNFLAGDAHTLLPLAAPADVIAANIVSSVLEALLPSIAFALAPGGTAIFAGVLTEEQPAFAAALARNGFVPQQEISEDMWWTVAVGHQ